MDTDREVTPSVRVPAADVEGLDSGLHVRVVIDPETRYGRLLEGMNQLPDIDSYNSNVYDRVRFTNAKGAVDRRDQRGADWAATAR